MSSARRRLYLSLLFIASSWPYFTQRRDTTPALRLDLAAFHEETGSILGCLIVSALQLQSACHASLLRLSNLFGRFLDWRNLVHIDDVHIEHLNQLLFRD
jgi:hypothetical protein